MPRAKMVASCFFTALSQKETNSVHSHNHFLVRAEHFTTSDHCDRGLTIDGTRLGVCLVPQLDLSIVRLTSSPTA